ncbi:MAG TPA: hypothetical protein VEI97_03590, partial [bacterium]|nr:hypothetical protein [bacterium]
MRRLLTALALGLASAALSACGGGSDPLAPTPPDPHLVSHALPTGEVVSALFRLHMNKATGDIEALPVVRGGGTLEQGGIYSLDLQAFQSDRTFRIVAVDNLGDRLRVRFSHSHPLQAPDPSRPASASNRADLGYTGRLVILADLKADQVAGHIAYGDVVASTGAVLDPDGYVNPAGLLADGAYRANTFPYVLLADEAKDNRVDISNGGLMRGSYRPEAGWERDSLRYGWTGYDYVHAGQTITNSFEITLNALQAMSFEVNLAVLVKYTEPKGEPGRKWRLPPHNPVKHQFAYRLPHGALDCSVVEVAQDPFLFVDTVGGTRQVPVKVRDWDAQATEDPAGLSRESHVLAVTPGASGPPTVEIELLGAPGPSLAPAPIEGNGEPGTELQYSVPFTRTAAMGNSHRTALLRVTDPEIPNGSFTGVFQAGLDPTTLAPDAQRALRPVTYQALTVVFPGTATGEAFGTTIDITPGNYSPLVPLTAGTPDASD